MSTLSVIEPLPPSFALEETAALNVLAVVRRLMPTARGRVDERGWIEAARHHWEELPVGLRRAVGAFRRDSGDHGILLLRGLPVDPSALPSTPMAGESVQRDATVAAALLLMTACGLGEPVAFRPEKAGAMVQDVVPVPGKESFQGNAGSVTLSFHNENAFHPHRPDFVLLLCLRPDHDRVAGTRVACIRQVLPLLTETTRSALRAQEFATQAPPSFGTAGERPVTHAVLSGDPADPDIQVDLAATRGLTRRSRDALVELGVVFEETSREVVLDTGDLIVVDNRVTVHGRSSFNPRYDGRDRWLQRTFSVTNLRASRLFRTGDGHILD